MYLFTTLDKINKKIIYESFIEAFSIMYLFTTLDKINKKIIYESFIEAFSDYSVNIFLPYEDFEKMLIGKGFNSEISIGFLKSEKILQRIWIF